MNKNLKIIDVNGIKGLLIFLFIVTCLIVGFFVFPGFVAMAIWNMMSSFVDMLPQINFIAGLLLWGIIVVSAYMMGRHKVLISLKTMNHRE